MCIVSPALLVPRGKEVTVEVRQIESATETQASECQL